MLIAWNQYCNILFLAHCLLWKIKPIFLITNFLKWFSQMIILNCMLVLFYKIDLAVSHIIPFYFCMNYFAWFNVCILMKHISIYLKIIRKVIYFYTLLNYKESFQNLFFKKISINCFFLYLSCYYKQYRRVFLGQSLQLITLNWLEF